MNSRTHPDELLVWYVNGTLEASERKIVETHLRDCQRCRDEIALLRALRSGMKNIDGPQTPGELGRQRLLRDVRKRRALARIGWRPALAAAAAVIIVIQGVLLANVWPRAASITPLGGKPADKLIQVEFQPNATEAQIRLLLQQTGAALIDGPGALGIYRLRVEKTEAALETLRARSDVVKHAAPD